MMKFNLNVEHEQVHSCVKYSLNQSLTVGYIKDDVQVIMPSRYLVSICGT